ncbi:MAG: GNAT family N-acetyltransferase [Prochloron sp. SP5CPC1]|nr:GNAT family N-acetyltransferase [Candidatus Paraprochloron terpiosi SP5CPC1]
MTFVIQQVHTSDQISLCHQLQIAIFHDELGLFGMQIPDKYDRYSAYMQMEIIGFKAVVGTYRVVLPNSSIGLPILETGFALNPFDPNRVCEMSRLVVLKEKRAKIPFSKIIASACRVAKKHNNSTMVAAILPHNVPLFQRYGFSPAGPPLNDSSVESTSTEESIIIPMKIHI